MWHQWFTLILWRLCLHIVMQERNKITTLFNNLFSSVSVFDACLGLAVLCCLCRSESSQISSKISQFVFWKWTKVLQLGTTWGWVINDRIFIFGWTIPLKRLKARPRYIFQTKSKKRTDNFRTKSGRKRKFILSSFRRFETAHQSKLSGEVHFGS